MVGISCVVFFPIFLILHCIFIFLFKRWLGPLGTFYGSVSIFGLCIGCAGGGLYGGLYGGNY